MGCYCTAGIFSAKLKPVLPVRVKPCWTLLFVVWNWMCRAVHFPVALPFILIKHVTSLNFACMSLIGPKQSSNATHRYRAS